MSATRLGRPIEWTPDGKPQMPTGLSRGAGAGDPRSARAGAAGATAAVARTRPATTMGGPSRDSQRPEERAL